MALFVYQKLQAYLGINGICHIMNLRMDFHSNWMCLRSSATLCTPTRTALYIYRGQGIRRNDIYIYIYIYGNGRTASLLDGISIVFHNISRILR
jgi:hypothetical protein